MAQLVKNILKSIFVLALALITVAMLVNTYSYNRTTNAPPGQSREAWLATFKPMEVAGECQASPLRSDFKGTHEECMARVSALFDQCTIRADRVRISPVISSRWSAEQWGSLVGNCIAAHYFGGDRLRVFNETEKAEGRR